MRLPPIEQWSPSDWSYLGKVLAGNDGMGRILTHRRVLPRWMFDAMEAGGREIMRDRRDPNRGVMAASLFEIEIHDRGCVNIRDLNYPPGYFDDVDADAIDAEVLRAAGEALVKLREESG